MELTEAEEERGHGLVLGHVDQPSAQAEVGEDQQDLLDDVVDVGDVLRRTRKSVVSRRKQERNPSLSEDEDEEKAVVKEEPSAFGFKTGLSRSS